MKEPNNEAELEQLIAMDAVQFGCFLMRNNAGAFKDETGRLVRYGLDNTSEKRNREIKSSDRIGFTRVTITPEMVGKTLAVFTAVEVKHPGWMSVNGTLNYREKAQQAFIKWIVAAGGFAGFADSIDTFRRIIGR